jgi:hypothetical protein
MCVPQDHGEALAFQIDPRRRPEPEPPYGTVIGSGRLVMPQKVRLSLLFVGMAAFARLPRLGHARQLCVAVGNAQKHFPAPLIRDLARDRQGLVGKVAPVLGIIDARRHYGFLPAAW